MKFGLDVAISSDFADPRKLADLAVEAEQAGWDGIYLMTVNQMTNELLTPAEIKEIAAFIQAHRRNTEPFDIALNVDIPSDPIKAANVVQPYLEAGATWCISLSPNTVEQYKERIRLGPPKL